MAERDIYIHDSYRDFLKTLFPSSGQGRGQRASLAKHLGCQTSFISLVLSGKAHLNEDMAFAACEFLNLSSDETAFFLNLFHLEKAGTQKLRQHYQSQIKRTLQNRAEIKSRVASDRELDVAMQMRFFSDWLYGAIMTVVQIPGYRDIKRIAEKLRVSEEIASQAIAWMLEHGFLEKKRSELAPSIQRIHLGNDSLFIDHHHRNWRHEAIRSLGRKGLADLHFSGVISLSTRDYEKVREIWLQAVSEIEAILRPSKEEELVGICFDLFKY